MLQPFTSDVESKPLDGEYWTLEKWLAVDLQISAASFYGNKKSLVKVQCQPRGLGSQSWEEATHGPTGLCTCSVPFKKDDGKSRSNARLQLCIELLFHFLVSKVGWRHQITALRYLSMLNAFVESSTGLTGRVMFSKLSPFA